MTLTTNVRGSIRYSITGAPDLGSAKASRSHVDSADWANGTSANQADLVFSDTRTVAASTVDSLDLSGSLTDVLGNSAVFVKVKAIEIRSASANGDTITIGGASSNAFVGPFADSSDKIQLRPGGIFVISSPDATGWAVTASTADILAIENDDSSDAATYDIVIVGTSA